MGRDYGAGTLKVTIQVHVGRQKSFKGHETAVRHGRFIYFTSLHAVNAHGLIRDVGAEVTHHDAALRGDGNDCGSLGPSCIMNTSRIMPH